MEIGLDLYRIFYYVCEFKNITKVAKLLYVTQPAITKSVKKLEEELGRSLITRNTRGIELTKDGMLLYEKIKPLIEEMMSIENLFRENNNHDLTLKIIAGNFTLKNLLVKPMIKLQEKYPDIKFQTSAYPQQESIQQLRDGKADLIFLGFNDVTEKYNDIIIKKFYDVQDILVVSKDVKKNFPDKIKISEINNYPIICKASKIDIRKNAEEYLEEHGIILKPKYEVANNWIVKDYVEMNLGIGILTREFIKDDLESGNLVEIPMDCEFNKREIGYAYRKNSVIENIIKEFIRCMLDSI